ncbi:MAG: hypothetical protein E7Z86_10140 [Methanosphaera stadtmanae]|nr:hypothetical protein [Methanosphaera stadtmanae]
MQEFSWVKYNTHKMELQIIAKELKLKSRDKYKNELAYISRIILKSHYGNKPMNCFLDDFEFYFRESVEYVFSILKGDKNHLSIYHAVIIAIGIIDNYYDALLLLEASGIPFLNIEYDMLMVFLQRFYSNEAIKGMSIKERIDIKDKILDNTEKEKLNLIFM